MSVHSFTGFISFYFSIIFKRCCRPQKLRCCRSMVHSVLVNRSKSSSEKSTGLSRELCRLGDRQASPAKKVRSGIVDAPGGAEEEVVVTGESRCSENAGLDAAAADSVSLSCIRPGLSAEFVAVKAGGEWWFAAASEEPDAPGSGGRLRRPKWPRSSGVGCALSPLSLAWVVGAAAEDGLPLPGSPSDVTSPVPDASSGWLEYGDEASAPSSGSNPPGSLDSWPPPPPSRWCVVWRLCFIRRFWNQTLTCRSVRSKRAAISTLLGRHRYLLKWNSFSSSSSCVLV